MSARDAAPPVALSVTEATRHIPAHVEDRRGWAADVVAAITALDKAPTAERVCAVIAVIEQESGYQPDPVVKDLPRIVRTGLEDKLGRLGPLKGPAVSALLSGKAAGSDLTFAERVEALRTERDLDRLFRDMARTYRDKMPGPFAVASALSRVFGRADLEDLNPVTTAGSMQVKVAFARTLDGFEDAGDEEARELLYTRAGGIRAGTARLLGYPASYDDVIYRFADYNAGVYASRNAAFQMMLSDLLGRDLARDGDLLAYGDDGTARNVETQSLRAMLAFGEGRDLWAWRIRRAAAREKTVAFEDTAIWREVRDA